jgi:DNA-binding transcriptional ArsR family regulator
MDENRPDESPSNPPIELDRHAELARLAHNANKAREVRVKAMPWAEHAWRTGTPDEQRHATDVISDLWKNENNASLSFTAADPLRAIVQGEIPCETPIPPLDDEDVRILRYLHEQRVEPAQETPIEHIQLEDGAYKILHTLGSSPTRLHQEELSLCEDPSMDRRTVSRHLRILKAHGLIDYNPRDKKGATILEKGRAYLNSLPK